MWCCGNKLEGKNSSKELEHNKRRREIEGCVKCGKEIRPGNQVMVCGLRFDRWTVCYNCYKKRFHEFCTPMYSEIVLWEIDPGPFLKNCSTVSSALKAVFNVYFDRPCLGFLLSHSNGASKSNTNATDDNKSQSSKFSTTCYNWISYEQVGKEARLIGLGLKALLAKRESKVEDEFDQINPNLTNCSVSLSSAELCRSATVLLYAEASVEWYLMQYGCLLERLLVVPILDGTPKHQLKEIIQKCLPSIIITSTSQYVHVRSILDEFHLNKKVNFIQPKVVIICLASQPPYLNDSYSSKKNLDNVYHTSDIVGMGKGSGTIKSSLSSKELKDEDQEDTPRMLIPTSGSTGTPKLIMVTDKMMMRQFTPPSFGVRTVLYSFQPIRQPFDTLVKGGRIGLWSGDLGNLCQDMKILRPTHFASTPVFWIAQLQKFNSQLQNTLSNLVNDQKNESREEVRANLIMKWRDQRLLGNRCKSVLIGGAPSSEELRRWIWDVFGVSVTNGYGTSETGAIASNSDAYNQSNLQLIDVPDMGFLTSDVPHPRGEIVAFTNRMTPGYFNDPIANEHAFLKIGEKKYFRTGDIGMIADGKLTVIDRKGALFKLANGVFIAPAPLETLFAQSPLMHQVLVFGRPGCRTISAVVVLSSIGIQACSKVMERTIDSELDPNPILKECSRLALASGRREYEVPQAVILSTDEWTVENGCLTSSLKPCRPVLMKKFTNDLDRRLIKDSDEDCLQTSHVSPVCNKYFGTQSGLSTGLEQALRETIPQLSSLKVDIPSFDTNLYQLGVDSMALSVLRSALQSRFGIDIPLPQLAGTTLLDLNTAVLGGGFQSLPNEEDGPESLTSEVIAIRDSWKEASFDKKEIEIDLNNSSTNGTSDGITGNFSDSSKFILLTGATGFVGAFLLKELVHMEDSSHVICLVRAKSNRLARERVELSLKEYLIQCDPIRWSVMAGDLAKDYFDLAKSDWNKLISCISVVFHAGAVVNASLPLAAIRAPNVSGTKTIVELCVAANAELHHISTASVLGGSSITQEVLDIPPPSKYNTAYAKSKWLAEQIVRHGVTDLGIRARIYRLGTMSSHSITGACNRNDTFTRIVKGIITLKSITSDKNSPLPKGFYLAPIDWAIKALCTISQKSANMERGVLNDKKGIRIPEEAEVFHILSNNLVSISTVYDAIKSRGISLEICSASEFRDKLGGMDESNDMYSFRDVFKTGSSERFSSMHLSTEKTNTMAYACPVVDERIILKMLQFLGY